MHTQCIPNAYPMHTQCIPNAYPMHTQCIPNAYPMHTQCIPNAYPMHTQCIPNAYPMHTQCIHAYHFMDGCCSSIVVYQLTSNNRCVTSTGSHKQCHTCLSSPVRCLLSPVTQPKLSVNMMCGVHVLLCFSALQCGRKHVTSSLSTNCNKDRHLLQ